MADKGPKPGTETRDVTWADVVGGSMVVSTLRWPLTHSMADLLMFGIGTKLGFRREE